MGKHAHEHNKPHRKKKDKGEHKERSKQEHLLRKQRKAEAKREAELERTRYTLDDRSREKLLTALKALLAENPATLAELPAVFQMLDDALEVDIVDIESGFVREKLEIVLNAMSGMVGREENAAGRFVYKKVCRGSVKDQIESYLKVAQEAPREEWMTGMTAHLQSQFGPQFGPSQSVQLAPDSDLSAYMDEYNRVNRPKSLMEMHREARRESSGEHPEARSSGYLYGDKTLQKRFGKGSFYSSFM